MSTAAPLRSAELSTGHETTPRNANPAARLRPVVGGLVILTTVLLVIAVVLAPYSPPSVAPVAAPASQFSAERALPALQTIAQHPRPVGSAADAAIGEYLVQHLSALGLQPDNQQTAVLDPRGGQAVVVHNVLARIPGTTTSRALLVTAHYDSVETTPGVGDNGMAVAAMLETIRAIQAGPPLRNDVVFLFNDGEEYGLSGSVAFVEEHPWARDVAMVFDFDGDNPNGAPTVEWMTPGDSWIVRELARSDSGLLASPEDVVSKRLDNNNDLHVLAAAGYAGAHIGRIGGSTYYHNQRDSLGSLVPGGLQQEGDVMLALVRHFGNIPLEGATSATEDSVVFTVFGTQMLSYPFGWTVPLAALAVLLALGAAGLGWRRGRLTPVRLIGGIATVLGVAIAGAVVAQVAWQVIMATHPESRVFRDADFYGQAWYVGALYAIALAACLALWSWLIRKFGGDALTTAGTLGIATMGLVLSQLQPSIAYLVIWPAIAGAIGLMFFLAIDRTRHPWVGLALLVVIAVPAVGFPVAGLYQGIAGGAEGSPALSIALLLLLLALLTPQVGLVAALSHRWMPVAMGVLGGTLLIGGGTSSGFDATHPRPVNLVYTLDAATGQAYWAAPEGRLDAWTGQFLVERSARTMDELFGAGRPTTLVSSPAPAVQLPSPELLLRGEERDGSVRTLRLHLVSPRQAWRAYVVPGPGVELLGAALGDGSLVVMQTGSLDVPGLPVEGLDFTFQVRADGPLSFSVIDQTPGLPEVAGAVAQPTDVMPASTPDNLRGFASAIHTRVVFP
jgi:hypothetical protein